MQRIVNSIYQQYFLSFKQNLSRRSLPPQNMDLYVSFTTFYILQRNNKWWNLMLMINGFCCVQTRDRKTTVCCPPVTYYFCTLLDSRVTQWRCFFTPGKIHKGFTSLWRYARSSQVTLFYVLKKWSHEMGMLFFSAAYVVSTFLAEVTTLLRKTGSFSLDDSRLCKLDSFFVRFSAFPLWLHQRVYNINTLFGIGFKCSSKHFKLPMDRGPQVLRAKPKSCDLTEGLSSFYFIVDPSILCLIRWDLKLFSAVVVGFR